MVAEDEISRLLEINWRLWDQGLLFASPKYSELSLRRPHFLVFASRLPEFEKFVWDEVRKLSESKNLASEIIGSRYATCFTSDSTKPSSYPETPESFEFIRRLLLKTQISTKIPYFTDLSAEILMNDISFNEADYTPWSPKNVSFLTPLGGFLTQILTLHIGSFSGSEASFGKYLALLVGSEPNLEESLCFIVGSQRSSTPWLDMVGRDGRPDCLYQPIDVSELQSYGIEDYWSMTDNSCYISIEGTAAYWISIVAAALSHHLEFDAMSKLMAGVERVPHRAKATFTVHRGGKSPHKRHHHLKILDESIQSSLADCFTATWHAVCDGELDLESKPKLRHMMETFRDEAIAGSPRFSRYGPGLLEYVLDNELGLVRGTDLQNVS